MAFDVPTKDQFLDAIRHPLRWYSDGGPEDPFEDEVRKKRIRIVALAFGFLFLAGVGLGGYGYFITLETRSEQAYIEGEKLLRPNGYEDAIVKFDHALSLNGRNEKAHLARGEALALLGNREEALKAFTRVIEIKPNWARGYAARGRLYRQAGETQKALDDLNTSVQLEENSENLLERGQAFATLGQWQKAIDDYTLYIKIREGVPYPYMLRAVARRQLGDEAGAQEDKIQALIYESKLPTLFGKTGRNQAPPSTAGKKPPESKPK